MEQFPTDQYEGAPGACGSKPWTLTLAQMIGLMLVITLAYIGAHAVADAAMGRSMDGFWGRTLDMIWLPASIVPIAGSSRCGGKCALSRLFR
ncbi:MAG: hypothetical protein H6810_03795 [Phycisphaeraceae bacterium]|nr:MAG: hypothetical protein H6810_03795 [Phycisphaeraceae bacterium]